MSDKAIPDDARARFRALLSAAVNHELALVCSTDLATGQDVYVICQFETNEDGTQELTPLAEQYKDNPYARIALPIPDSNTLIH